MWTAWLRSVGGDCGWGGEGGEGRGREGSGGSLKDVGVLNVLEEEEFEGGKGLLEDGRTRVQVD